LWAYVFAAELFLVGLLMVSTLGFPSFKKRSQHPRASMWMAVSIVMLLSLLIMFPRHFFLGFFGVFVLLTLALNLAWRFGFTRISPPATRGRDPECTEDTLA